MAYVFYSQATRQSLVCLILKMRSENPGIPDSRSHYTRRRHLLLLGVMVTTRTRVKICGITRLEDALAAESLGVDALGFVFVPASKRYIHPQAAAEIAQQLSAFTTVVGLFLDASASTVEQTINLMPDILLQFHGREKAEYCDGFNRPYIKAIGLGNTEADPHDLSAYEKAKGFLFDSNEPGALGGTGHAFDWARLDNTINEPVILAGGINTSNVQNAILEIKPYAVDVSSGVESAKGIKDALAMRQFMRAVTDADVQLASAQA